MHRASLSSIALSGSGASSASLRQAADYDASERTVDFGGGDDDGPSSGHGKKKDKKKTTGGFQSFGLSPQVFKGIMKMGFKVPTPVQRKAIPALLSGADVVAMARTGSGKTAAFLIPMLDKLGTRDAKAGVRGLVLSPTRELAMQTSLVSSQLGKFTGLRSCLLVGGTSMSAQFAALDDNPDILIATPGRLMHHLIEVKFSLKQVEYCVFDEADRLFEMGFAAQLHEILKQLGDERQTSLFSATLPKQLVEFTRAGLKEPIVKIRLDVESKISPQLRMVFLTLRRDQKLAALLILLREQIHKGEQTIVFAATRHHVEYLHMMLTTADMASAPVYGQLDPAARKINIAKFRTKKCSILLVTDVAARGIDIPLLDNVINFDFPAKPKLFIHRAGRVARAGRTGVAYSFVAPDEMPYMIDLHLFFGRKLINAVPEGEAYRDEEVYYGNFPREQLEIECEAVKALRVQAQAQRQWEVSERAYQQYNKTREGASTASAQRAKALPPPALHPMFARVQSESSRSVEQYLAGIRNYKGASTIFEVKQLHIKGGAEIMKAKRGEHDYSIARKLVEEERERENQRKAEEIKVNYNKAGFKSVDKSDLPEYNHAEDDEEGAPADDEDDDDEEDDEEADADEFDADAQAEEQEDDEDADEEQEQDGEENEDDEDEEAEEAEDGEEMEDDEEAEGEEEDEAPSAVRSSMQRMYGANSSKKTSTTKGTKRKGAADDEDDEAAAAQSARASSSSASAAAAEKAHKTKKQRQLEKKQKLAAGGQQSSTRNGGDSDDDDNDDDQQGPDDGDAPSRRRRSALVSTEGKYRDAAFFISETPGDAASERGLALDGGSGSNMRLEDMVLDTLGDDEQAFAKARAVHTWDARKKKYIRTMVGGDPFKKQRNEAGQLIRAKDQPDLYNAWKKAHKKGVASAADSMGDDGGDDGEGGGGDESEGPDRTPRGRARERRGGGTAGSARGGGRGGKSGASSRASSASSKKGGSAGGSELKSTDEIRKARAQKEKNKQKNQRGGRSGGARGSRGAGMGGSFRSSSRDGGEGRSRSRGPPRGGMSRGGRGGGGGGGSRGGGGGGRGGGGGGRGGRGGGGGGRGGGGRGGGRGRGR